MIGMRAQIRGCLVALSMTVGVCGLATSAPAQEEHDRLQEAWADLVLDQEPILSEAQFAKLNNLAYQAAVTKVCDGYLLDQTAFAEGLADAMSEQPEEASQEEIRHWEAAVLFRLGATYGLFLAEGNEAPEDFCANAAELKEANEAPHYWQ